MENKKLVALKTHIDDIFTLVEALSIAKTCDFISGPEAANILKDVLREAGLKDARKPFTETIKEEAK